MSARFWRGRSQEVCWLAAASTPFLAVRSCSIRADSGGRRDASSAGRRRRCTQRGSKQAPRQRCPVVGKWELRYCEPNRHQSLCFPRRCDFRPGSGMVSESGSIAQGVRMGCAMGCARKSSALQAAGEGQSWRRHSDRFALAPCGSFVRSKEWLHW